MQQLWWWSSMLISTLAWKVVDILQTPVVSFLPDLKVHHVAIVQRKNEVYALDFTHRDTGFGTKVKLLLGATVPARVRVRKLPPSSLSMVNQSVWENAMHEEEELVVEEWAEMNLYFRNCQHFVQTLSSCSNFTEMHVQSLRHT
jgi:hypothetical protein